MPAHSGRVTGWLKEVGWHSVVYGVGAVLQVALSFLLMPLYTSQWSPAEFAVFNLAITAAALAGAFFYLGAYSSLSRFYFDHDDEERRRSVATAGTVVTLIGAAFQIAVVCLAARPLSAAILGSADYSLILILAVATSALTFVNQIFLLVLRLRRRSTAVVTTNLVALALTLVAVLLLVLWRRWGVMGAVAGALFGQAAIAPWLAWVVRDVFVGKIYAGDLRKQMAYGMPSVVISFGYYALDQSDRVLLQHLTSLNQVAIYSAGYGVGRVVQALFVQPFAQIWNPMRLEYRKHDESSRLSALVLTYYCLAGLTLVVGLSLFASQIVSVVARRPEYAGASRVIPIVLFSHLIYGSLNLIDTGILVNNRMWTYTALLAGALALNVGLNLWWIPQFGYMAAAWATLCSYAAFVAIVFVVSNRLTPVVVEPRRLILAISSAVATVLVRRLGPENGLAAIVWQTALFGGLIAFWVMVALDSRERRWLADAISRGKTFMASRGA